MRRLLSVVLLSVSFFVIGCGGGKIAAGDHSPVKYSAWIAYWDVESALKEKIKADSVMYFAAYFDENDRLFVPAEISDLRKNGGSAKSYLTFVNDVSHANGKTKLKDIEVLRRALKDDAAQDAHAAAMLKIAADGNYDGIELDYEGVWKDDALWKKFLSFTYKLAKKTAENNVALRIVLEPNAPMDAPYVKGPDYVVMLYNLYGTHSGPGPKADGDFIVEKIKGAAKIPGKKCFAIATGGCLWERTGPFGLASGGEKKQITEKEALAFLKKNKAQAKRDNASAALYFDFESKGKKYTVWYADSETLSAWITAAAGAGAEEISFWRLGGNSSIGKVR